MHTLSASNLKHNTQPHNLKPREGTKLRAVYDRFYANKGRVILFKIDDYKATIAQLTDIYGLDIRRIHNGQWALVGEWFGRVYLDYTDQGRSIEEC
jgi:hypothetical protein